MVRYIILLILSSGVYAQEDYPLSCEDLRSMMPNWIHQNVYIESWNKKYLAIGDNEGIRTYIKRGKDYISNAEIDKSVSIGTKFYMNEHGNFVTFGDSYALIESEVIDIFDINGEIVRSIGASDVLSKVDIQLVKEKYQLANKCSPDQPWICWSHEPYLEDDILFITSALGNEVQINIQSGKVIKKSRGERCEKL